MADWYPGSGVSYAQYLQQKSFTEDITEAQRQAADKISKSQRRAADKVSSSVSAQTKEIVGSLDSLEASVTEELDYLGHSLSEIQGTLDWGFTNLLGELSGLQDSLDELIEIAKTPAQTAAYEHFEIARDAFRKQLYPECLESLDRAINGDEHSPGYSMEWRFHYLRGLVLLGSYDDSSQDVIDLEGAEAAFGLAVRYARSDHPKEAALASLSSGWAAYVQADDDPSALDRAEEFMAQATALNPDLAEAHFRHAEVLALKGRLKAAIESLRNAILKDLTLLERTLSSRPLTKHDSALQSFLAELREEQATTASDLSKRMLKKWQPNRAELIHGHDAAEKWEALAELREYPPLGDLLYFLKVENRELKRQYQSSKQRRRRKFKALRANLEAKANSFKKAWQAEGLSVSGIEETLKTRADKFTEKWPNFQERADGTVEVKLRQIQRKNLRTLEEALADVKADTEGNWRTKVDKIQKNFVETWPSLSEECKSKVNARVSQLEEDERAAKERLEEKQRRERNRKRKEQEKREKQRRKQLREKRIDGLAGGIASGAASLATVGPVIFVFWGLVTSPEPGPWEFSEFFNSPHFLTTLGISVTCSLIGFGIGLKQLKRLF